MPVSVLGSICERVSWLRKWGVHAGLRDDGGIIYFVLLRVCEGSSGCESRFYRERGKEHGVEDR